jgi:signal transduction histidine kinase
LLCWLLAYYLTTPLRGLQKTLERFGRGDFSARSGSRRRDELGQLSRTFDVMAARTETLLESQRRLLLDISHELRSPLTRLGVAVEIARGQMDNEASLNRIQREADRLNALVDQLLRVTRAESEPDGPHEAVQLDELLREIAADCDIEASSLGTSIDVSTEPVTVQGDEELLRRAAENILRNALRYSPPGKPVLASVRRDGASAVLGIRDWGTGVPENQLLKIFDHFYRVDSDRNRQSGGAGLGLSIARRAVELHHGSIAARNVGPGLLVEIRLPASSESESRSAA